MHHVLVHIDLDRGLGPIGAWSYCDGQLTHFYPESLDLAIPARARHWMAYRTPEEHSVPEWFGYLADYEVGAPHDEYEAIEVDGTVNLPQIVAEFRRTWSASR